MIHSSKQFGNEFSLRIDSFVPTEGSVVVDLFGKDVAQFNQQLGLEHPVSVDLALHLEHL